MRLGTFIWLLYASENAVALQSSSVTLTCGFSGDIRYDSLEWRSYIDDSVETMIYNSTTGLRSNSSKYAIDDDYSLTIKSLTIADERRYYCILGSDGVPKSADVIVIKPEINLSPYRLSVGQPATVTCSSSFGSPREGDMDTNEIPQMAMWIEGTLANASVISWNKVRGIESTLSSTGDHTASSDSQRIAVRFHVSTSIPSFYTESTDKVMVKYPNGADSVHRFKEVVFVAFVTAILFRYNSQ